MLHVNTLMQYDDEYSPLDEEVTSAGPWGRYETFPKKLKAFTQERADRSQQGDRQNLNEDRQQDRQGGRQNDQTQRDQQGQKERNRQNQSFSHTQAGSRSPPIAIAA